MQPAQADSLRDLAPGMAQAVAERTVLRQVYDLNSKFLTVSSDDPACSAIVLQAQMEGRPIAVDNDNKIPHFTPSGLERWRDVAARVAAGNTSLMPITVEAAARQAESEGLRMAIGSGALPMSGRHLQHGDLNQAERNMEVFTNCSTSAASFLKFQHLLNGSGVGRCYDDDLMIVDWDNAPSVFTVISEDHPDFIDGRHLSARNAKHMFGGSRDMLWYEVPDSREGWSKALELIEVAAFEKVHRDKLTVLDFSLVRERGSPIKGMQGRPSSGPVALMDAFSKAMMIRGAGLARWKQAIYIDHFFAECVLVGGARRAARIGIKFWKDKTVLDFIRVKRPVEYDGKTMDEVIEMRRALSESGQPMPQAFLWSANNSVAVDEEFWDQHLNPGTWANQVYVTAVECAYGDGTGEPGFVNVDKLVQNDEGWGDLYRGDWVGSKKYQPKDQTHIFLSKLAKRAQKKKYHTITNPCGEIALNVLGGYCTLAAMAPYFCSPRPGLESWDGAWNEEWDAKFENTARIATRALIRVNTMDSVYGKEVARTNRIGVGLIGIHEWMWARFGLTFREAIDETGAIDMWRTLGRMSQAVMGEADTYSKSLGLVSPHTRTTIPPGGTISKLFGLTEGAHLSAMPWYMRWVQFRNDDPLIESYQDRGYPVRVLKQYKGHTIIGFPTQQEIAKIMPHDKLVTAAQATPEEQYAWLRLLEKWWIEGGVEGDHRGNQISYTLKYDPKTVSFESFCEMISIYQPLVRACSLMPVEDGSAYEYLPEEPLTHEQFVEWQSKIRTTDEEIGVEHMSCENGACGVDYNDAKGVIQDHGYA